MAEAKDAWDKATSELQAFGSSLKQHYDSEADSARKAADKQRVDNAMRGLGDSVNATMDALGSTARRPEVRDQARGAGAALLEALAASFSDLGESLRRGRSADAAPPVDPEAITPPPERPTGG